MADEAAPPRLPVRYPDLDAARERIYDSADGYEVPDPEVVDAELSAAYRAGVDAAKSGGGSDG